MFTKRKERILQMELRINKKVCYHFVSYVTMAVTLVAVPKEKVVMFKN